MDWRQAAEAPNESAAADKGSEHNATKQLTQKVLDSDL
jgi:hypothetical protein